VRNHPKGGKARRWLSFATTNGSGCVCGGEREREREREREKIVSVHRIQTDELISSKRLCKKIIAAGIVGKLDEKCETYEKSKATTGGSRAKILRVFWNILCHKRM